MGKLLLSVLEPEGRSPLHILEIALELGNTVKAPLRVYGDGKFDLTALVVLSIAGLLFIFRRAKITFQILNEGANFLVGND